MNIQDVENLAELARLELSTEEKESLLKDLEGVLGYIKMIEEAEVPEGKIEHTLYNRWREDLPRVKADREKDQDFSKDLIVEQFPDSQDGFLKVKKIL